MAKFWRVNFSVIEVELWKFAWIDTTNVPDARTQLPDAPNTALLLPAVSAKELASAVVLPLRPEMVSRFTHSLSTSMLAAIETVMMFWAHGQLEVWVMPAVVHEEDMISSRVPWMFMVDSVLEIWGTEMVTVTPDTEGVALLRIENEKT